MKKINNNIDDFVSILIIIFFILIGTLSVSAQTFTVTKCDMHDHYVIDFIDEFDDTYYIDGSKVIVRGKLDLNEKQYKQLIKDIKKTLKYTEHELDRPNYAVIKYGWVKDSAWVYWDKKAFSVTKRDIKYLNSKL